MVVLPTPPFGLKTTTIVPLRSDQPSIFDVRVVQDRAAAVVDGRPPDAHRFDAPADRVGREGSGQVLVFDGVGGAGQPVE